MAAFDNWSALHVLNRIARDDYDVPADRQTARLVATRESAEAIAAINNPEASDEDRIKEIEEAIDALSAKREAIRGRVD